MVVWKTVVPIPLSAGFLEATGAMFSSLHQATAAFGVLGTRLRTALRSRRLELICEGPNQVVHLPHAIAEYPTQILNQAEGQAGVMHP